MELVITKRLGCITTHEQVRAAEHFQAVIGQFRPKTYSRTLLASPGRIVTEILDEDILLLGDLIYDDRAPSRLTAHTYGDIDNTRALLFMSDHFPRLAYRKRT